MHPGNHTKEALADGGRAFGARSNSFSPDLVEVYGELGLDFGCLDIEHAARVPGTRPASNTSSGRRP